MSYDDLDNGGLWWEILGIVALLVVLTWVVIG